MKKKIASVPYYQNDCSEIYFGDALVLLQKFREDGRMFDNVTTDPPYASGTRAEARKSSSGAMVRAGRFADKPIENDQMTTSGFVWLMRETFLVLRDMIHDGDSVLCFIDWRQWPNLLGAVESTNLRVNGMIVWDKLSFGLGNVFRNRHELIMHASKGVPRAEKKNEGNVIPHKRDSDPNHPSPKPPELIERLIAPTCPVGGTVIDPYMGAGSTAVACRRLGMKFVGIESQESYCEVAANKLRTISR